MHSHSDHNPSLWMATSDRGPAEPLAGDVDADVAIIGGGITGLTTARLLSDAGVDVVVIDAGDIAAGVTGYTTAKVTALQASIYSTLTSTWNADVAAVYADANQAAIATVRELVAADGIDCDLAEGPSFTYVEDPAHAGRIEAEVDAATRAGLPVKFTTETELPYPVAAAVRLDGQAQFHPRRYCLGLADGIQKRGGRVFPRTRATEVDAKEGRVVTSGGVVRAESIVVATLLPFLDRGGHFARTEPMRSYAVAVKPGDGRPLPSGMYISIDEPTRSVRATTDGWLVVGGEGHKVGHDTDTAARYSRLEDWARKRYAASTVGHRWSAHDYVSADHLPFIGRLSPWDRHVFVATGYAKWGMTNATVAGRILCDLIQDKDNPWQATFDSTRGAARQGARGIARANVDVAKHFVGDRLGFRTQPHPDVNDLRPGEGAIVDLDRRKTAAFRDDHGELHALSATCTHLGCQLAFNNAERSWDCPCHGSRFDTDGHVLNGPAVRDLDRRT